MRLRTNYPTRDIGRPVDYEAIKIRAASEHGIFVIDSKDHRLNDFDRQYLLNIWRKLFGPRANV